MTTYTFTVLLTFACFLVAFFRARWVALAIAPPCMLILARVAGFVDISSASHPLRLATALVGISLAMWAGWKAALQLRAMTFPPKSKGFSAWWDWYQTRSRWRRTFCASLIVFASDCTDIPALFLWQLPGEWVLVYVQMLACFLVLTVLLLPERWLLWKVS